MSGVTRTRRTAGLLLAALLSVGGCMPSVQEPDVRLEGVRVRGLGLEGGVLDVRLMVVNPNGFALEASGLDYTMELAAPDEDEPRYTRFADGEFRDELRVDARDSAVVEIPVRFEYRDVGAAVRSLLAQGILDYRVSGSVRLQEPLRRSIPFRKSGSVDIFD